VAIDVGDPLPNLAITITSDGTTLADAGTVVLTLTLPDGSTVTPTVNHPGTGSYNAVYIAAQAGQYLINWVATGANSCTLSDVRQVQASNPGMMISLYEARRGLGFQSGNTASDEDLRTFIAAATPIMEDLIGPVNTHVETYDGGSTQIGLLYPPVMSVTTVIESAGSNYQRTLTLQNLFTTSSTDAYGYTVDLTTGVLTRRAAGVAVPFLRGLRNIQVTYIAGRVMAGNHLLACRRLVKHLWQSEQQNYSPGLTSPEAIGLTPSGFAVPRAVIELCADSTRVQGLA
jgi:hypothetical protein